MFDIIIFCIQAFLFVKPINDMLFTYYTCLILYLKDTPG
jgi:hypothetical protein